jgi:hypothetical protein
MPGLDPGIHDFLVVAKTWMAGTSPAMTAASDRTPKRLSLTTAPDPQSMM